ncbi:MAG: T9SS type A sorting domain-containing protein [Taibaiella sp.]|nr:T9SS type A sorting domain-containing protein [Taibaiella sp.]
MRPLFWAAAAIAVLPASAQTRLSDINPNAGDANPQNFFVYGSNIYFLAKEATNRQEWYQLNTTNNTISQRTNDHSQLSGATIFRPPMRIGDNVFVASSKGGPSSNLYFSRFDLTTGNEVQWNPNNASSPTDPLAFAEEPVTGNVYATLFDAGSVTNQVFRWEKTTGNLTQFSSIGNAGLGSTSNTTNGALVVIGNNIYTTSYGGSGNNLNFPIVISMATPNTYTEITNGGNRLFEATRFNVINSKLYFVARTGSNAGPVNLFCYNPANTTLTALTSYTQTLASGNVNIVNITPDNSLLVAVNFYNTNPVQGEMLLVNTANNNSVTSVTNGVVTGTNYVFGFNSGDYSYFVQNGSPRQLQRYNRTDGTTTTAIPVSNGFTAMTNFFAATDGKAYFSAATSALGAELYSLDLSNNTTTLVADINTGSVSSTPGNFTQVGSTLYFAAKTDAQGRELYSMSITAPLAIQLDEFTARNSGPFNVISWTNLKEVAGDVMELQVSADGKAFGTIATFTATGKANAHYSYLDEHPFAGLNYYRLALKHVDGGTGYSDVAKAIVKAQQAAVEVYPNPAGNTINVASFKSGKVLISGMNGTTAFQASINSGSNRIDISTLPAGLYLLQVNDGQHVYNKRFVKQ